MKGQSTQEPTLVQRLTNLLKPSDTPGAPSLEQGIEFARAFTMALPEEVDSLEQRVRTGEFPEALREGALAVIEQVRIHRSRPRGGKYMRLIK